MGLLIINSPVSLDIALSLHEVSTYLTNDFIPSERFEIFNSSSVVQSFLSKLIKLLRVMQKVSFPLKCPVFPETVIHYYNLLYRFCNVVVFTTSETTKFLLLLKFY